MKILLVSAYFPPNNIVASLHAASFAKYWADAGEDVTVLTGVSQGLGMEITQHDEKYRVVEISYSVPKFLRTLRKQHKESKPETTSHKQSQLSKLKEKTGIFGSVRMPDLTDYWVKPARKWCNEQEPWDVVVSCSGPYTAHLVALSVKCSGLAKYWITDFRDLWVDNHLYRGLFPYTLRERKLQKQCLLHTDLATTVSDELAQTLKPQTHADVNIIYNGFEPGDLKSLNRERIFPDDDLVRIVYTGTLYQDGQDPSPILRAMATLKKNDPQTASTIKLVVAGHGSDQWSRLAQRYDVADLVEIHDIVQRSDALKMQRDADALLLIDWNDSSAGVLTGKLFEYIGQRTPILVVGGQGDSAISQMIEKTGRGRCFARDEESIAHALSQLIDSPQSLCDKPNHELISSLTRQAQSIRLLEMIRNLK